MERKRCCMLEDRKSMLLNLPGKMWRNLNMASQERRISKSLFIREAIQTALDAKKNYAGAYND